MTAIFRELVQNRHSVRDFEARPIDKKIVDAILNIVNRAPSAGDLQSYEIVLMTDKTHIAALAQATGGQEFISKAPVVLVFCANPGRATQKYGKRGADLFCVQDATIAAAYAQLAAVDLGLASTWVGAFDEDAVRKVVGGLMPVCILPLGYAAEHPTQTDRRPLQDIVHYEHL